MSTIIDNFGKPQAESSKANTPSDLSMNLDKQLRISSQSNAQASSQSADLWERAYESLKLRNPSLVKVYEQHLAAFIGLPGDCSQIDRSHIQAVINKRLKTREESQLIVRLGSHSASVREMGENVVTFILWSKDVVSSALSAQPYAALAWSGVSLLLSVYSPTWQTIV